MITINYVNLISEAIYTDTTWYKKIVQGVNGELRLNKESIKHIAISDLAKLPTNSVCIVIGFTEEYIQNAIAECLKNNLRPLIVGSYNKNYNSYHTSYVSVNREAAMMQNVSGLFQSGARNIALFGVNPSVYTDMSHLEGYKAACELYDNKDCTHNIFYNIRGIDETLREFINNYKNYDAVVCTNDYEAIEILARLNELGVRVPEEIQITGAGNTDVSALTNPPLTTLDIPLEENGKQAMILYRILQENPEINSLYSICEYNIIYRDSTKCKSSKRITNVTGQYPISPLEIVDYERAMKPIWNFADTFSQIDEVDKKIIYGIICNLSNYEIADSVFISSSTLSYRLNKLYDLTKVSGKEELRNLVKKYFPNYKV